MGPVRERKVLGRLQHFPSSTSKDGVVMNRRGEAQERNKRGGEGEAFVVILLNLSCLLDFEVETQSRWSNIRVSTPEKTSGLE